MVQTLFCWLSPSRPLLPIFFNLGFCLGNTLKISINEYTFLALEGKMVGDLVGRDTEIERERWQIQNRWEREEGCNLPLLMFKIFKENVTKQLKREEKKNYVKREIIL